MTQLASFADEQCGLKLLDTRLYGCSGGGVNNLRELFFSRPHSRTVSYITARPGQVLATLAEASLGLLRCP